MAVNHYDLGQTIRITNDDTTTSTPFTNADTGAVYDPDDIYFVVWHEDDGIVGATTYIYLTDSEVTRVSTGVYRLTFTPDTAGTWYVVLHGELDTGLDAVKKMSFVMKAA